MKYWDLEDLSGPLNEQEGSSPIVNIVWLQQWAVSAVGFDSSNLVDASAVLSHSRDTVDKRKSIANLRDTCWVIFISLKYITFCCNGFFNRFSFSTEYSLFRLEWYDRTFVVQWASKCVRSQAYVGVDLQTARLWKGRLFASHETSNCWILSWISRLFYVFFGISTKVCLCFQVVTETSLVPLKCDDKDSQEKECIEERTGLPETKTSYDCTSVLQDFGLQFCDVSHH